MSDEMNLFQIAASEPPLELRVKAARIEYDEAVTAFEQSDGEETGKILEQLDIAEHRLAILEAELLRRTCKRTKSSTDSGAIFAPK